MELDLDRQELGRSELEISGQLEFGLSEELPDIVQVEGRLAVQDIESRVLVNGTLTARGEAQCGRCLGTFELVWPFPVAVMVLRDVDSDEEEGETLLIQQRTGVVDLREAIRECTILAIPQSLVCRETCRGLCATCGIDLNHEVCDCTNEEFDPRWEGLPS
jgi:uncharacterized protein